MSRSRRTGGYEVSAGRAAWLLSLTAGHLSRGVGPAVEPLAQLKRRHAHQMPSAVQAWGEVRALLVEFDIETFGEPLLAGRWPSLEALAMRERVRVILSA